MTEIGKRSKYIEVISAIRKKIDSHNWEENTAIPTEREISTNFNVSRSTVRKAISMLIAEGYLRSEHGAGNFVMPKSSRYSHRFLHSFSDDIEKKGSIAGQEILEMRFFQPSEFIQKKLNITDENQLILRLKRLRFDGDIPIGIQTAYLSIKAEEAFDQGELLRIGSLYKLLFQKYGIELIEAQETLSARLPSAQEKQLLQLSADEVVLTCSRLTLSSKGLPIEYVDMVYAAHHYSYKARITRSSFQT